VRRPASERVTEVLNVPPAVAYAQRVCNLKEAIAVSCVYNFAEIPKKAV
jgi:hypothetical protein